MTEETELDRLYARVALQNLTVSHQVAWISVVFYLSTAALLTAAAYVVGEVYEQQLVGVAFVALVGVAGYRLASALRSYRRTRGMITSLQNAGVYEGLARRDVHGVEDFDEFVEVVKEKR